MRHPQHPAVQEFNHSPTHSLACLDSWPWRLEYSLGPELPRQHRRPCTVRNPQQPALQEFNHSPTHSLTRLSRQLAMAPGVVFESKIASPAQAPVYSAPSTTTCISRIQSPTHSLTRVSRQLAMAPGVTFWIRFTSPAGVSAQCAIHSTLLLKKSLTQTYSLVSTAGHGAWSNL